MSAAHRSSYGIYEAKTHFASLVERALAGEILTITKHGKPVARLVPLSGALRTPDEVAEMIATVEAIRASHGQPDVDVRELIGRADH